MVGMTIVCYVCSILMFLIDDCRNSDRSLKRDHSQVYCGRYSVKVL